jgi:amidase
LQTNCLNELLSRRALDRAKERDNFHARTGATRGSLHGVPVSIKSHIGVEGCHTPAAYVAWWDKIAPRDAVLVQILERAGAIVHARTTEPQTLMQLECVSNLYGVTVNPHNPKLSSGGSSGGEAALVAMGGSSIGVGSDVAGSIRVPAAACGIFGLKPTNFRIPTTGWGSIPPGADHIPAVLGPMCRTLDGIQLFMETVLRATPWVQEPALVPLPWRAVDVVPTPSKPLRLGIMRHDDSVMPHPPVSRALDQLSVKLATLQNVEVVDFAAYESDRALTIAFGLYFTDGGEADKKVLESSGEPLCPMVKFLFTEIPAIKRLSRKQLEAKLEDCEEYLLEFAEHWNKTGRWCEEDGAWQDFVDAVICPVMPGVANRHNTSKYFGYTAVWNVVDYPALAFPAGRVDARRDAKRARSGFLSEDDEENWDLCKLSVPRPIRESAVPNFEPR